MITIQKYILAVGLFLVSCIASLAQQSVELRILHTNDTHSCVMPINPNSADTAQADKGGFVRRATLLRELREKEPGLLLFDCGDFSQGSAYYNLYKGEVEVKLMNAMRYDAATIGNHEFDFGLDNMARFFQMADFPIVCANYKVEGTVLEGLVKPYAVIERKGLRIGVFGLGVRLEGLVSAENYKGIVYEEPISVANKIATLLKKQEQCDLVVCLSHLGWDIDGLDDTELVPQIRNVDIVLGGHSHTYFEKPIVLKDADGNDVYCNQMGKNGRFVGSLLLQFTSH